MSILYGSVYLSRLGLKYNGWTLDTCHRSCSNFLRSDPEAVGHASYTAKRILTTVLVISVADMPGGDSYNILCFTTSNDYY